MNRENFPTNSTSSNQQRGAEIQFSQRRPVPADSRDPVAAVIRPMQQLAGTDRSVRIDAAEPKPARAPHLRTHSLDDYVRWLREQSDRQKSVAKQSAQSTPSAKKSTLVAKAPPKPAPPMPAPAKLVPVNLMQIKSAQSKSVGFSKFKSPQYPTGTTSPLNQSPAKVSNKHDQRRTDEAHAIAGEHHAAPAPNLAPSDFHFETDLERILTKLNMPELLLPKKPIPVQIDAPEEKESVEQSTANTKKNNENIVRTVSHAIASVLNEPKASSTNVNAALQQKPAGPANRPANQKAIPQPMPASHNVSANPTNSGRHSRVKVEEIPANIAAWDVDDFRWPKVSNQMISAGAHAIESLTDSVFQSLGWQQRRLGVVSPGRGEGATAIAISVARWAAAEGQRVLLVDADLANPGLSQQVGLGPNISWINAIGSSLDPAEVIIRSQNAPICVMPMAPIVSRVGWPRFIYDQLGDLVDKVVGGFDMVVFDLGPASQLISELSQSRLLIDVGLIVHDGQSPMELLKTKGRLETFGIERFVVAQNTIQRGNRSNVA